MDRYCIQILRGDNLDMEDPANDVIRFTGLSWAEVMRLCKLSFKEQYAATVWCEDGGEAGEGE